MLQRWPLRRKLIFGTTTLVLVPLILSAAVTVLSLRASLYKRLDEDVRTGLQLAIGPEGVGPDAGSPEDDGPERAGPRPRVDSLEVVFAADGSTVSSAYVGRDGSTVSLTPAQLSEIAAAVEDEGTPATVELGGEIGSFRVAAQSVEDSLVVAGLSTRDVSATVASLSSILVVVVGAALLVAVLGLAWLVTAALRPLRRIADTAERVSRRPLEAGAVTMPERAGLAEDSRTEVGRVGAALDTLLNHVEAALMSRQESEDRLRAFVADASHELRTPLASVRGYALLAQSDETEMSATQARSLDRIGSEAERMASLVEDLLLLARLDAGQALRREPVDVSLLAIETADDAHAAYPDHEWLVEVDESIEVVGDEHRLRQVLINLLGNAGKHTPAGTRVTTSVTDGTEAVRIVVADDGPGIDPGLLPKLFDRFTRGDLARNRTSGSTGLGLSIAAAIVRAHGGNIVVESDHNGTEFTVTLPPEGHGPAPE
ncbi:HAMP domain-containing protein [Streptomyces sp. 3MP-14]|uniref:histidine kinase n=1 Tax=Streptomyces mimosae TaxID=2586635 RepID=A0A5N6AMW9_9ACTN|nr:HAMP domain-containing protein [Streptomyces mimosae]KAB8178732.1 HAMP domain-containing protein [Streptomyces sp. 3MP-14]